MNVTKLSLVPLQQASLCLDCDMITAAHTHCLSCGSMALLNIARTLNGEEHAGTAPQALAKVAGIASLRDFEPQRNAVQDCQRRTIHFVDEYVPSRQVATQSYTDRQSPNRWHSLRQFAAVVHRAVTVVLVVTFVHVGDMWVLVSRF
jgi:hypothetical protein